MITELSIVGLGVIDEAVLLPHPGLTAVTGETGAGKTMVVTALELIGGRRADSARVRSGADRAAVEARVDLPAGHPVATAVDAAGGRLDDDGSVILLRTVSADGRSRAHAGGRSVPLATLAEIAEPVVAVHGQSEAILLLRPAEQRRILDRYAHSEQLLADYRTARDDWRAACAELRERTGRARERAQREQVLRLGIAEIDQADPRPGEDTDLAAELRRQENADAVRGSAQTARDALAGESDAGDNAVRLIDTARRALTASGDDELTRWEPELHQAAALLVEIDAELTRFLDGLDADPARLEQVLTRQAQLRGLTRRYAADVNGVLAWRTDAAAELERLDSSEGVLTALRTRCADLAAAVAAAGSRLSRHRQSAATRLAEQASAELAHLALGRAQLTVRVAARPVEPSAADAVDVDGTWCAAGADGFDQVEILLRAHASAPDLPLVKGASGGELSRVMLALEVVLAAADPVGTLVFDEVDAGVGGKAATEIGLRLARLAATHQVVVVTHLAQVAAFADRQIVVEAGDDGAVRSSSLRVVADEERTVELARMLGGTDGAAARAHAAQLFTAAQSRR